MAPQQQDNPRPSIRRNTALNAAVGLAASVLALAYLDRATASGGALDWLICAVMTVIGVSQLIALVDGRTPLLLADDHELRVRLGSEWLGLPWSTLEQVVVEEREGIWRDGRVVVKPRNLGTALESLDRSARRHARWHRRWYGAPLSVPISVATRPSSPRLSEDLRGLADGRTDVVVLQGRERARLEPMLHARGELGRLVSRLGSTGHDLDGTTPQDTTGVGAADEPLPVQSPRPPAEPAGGPAAPFVPPPGRLPHDLPAAPPAATGPSGPRLPEQRPAPRPAPVPAARAARTVMRAEVVREEPPRIAVPIQEPVRVEHVEESAGGAVVFDDFAPRTAEHPVIGPELAQARERTGLTVDELSSRTMIRPHVIEAIEVDDFGPCGGDFYARGHLRTLARYLGLDVDELMERYDECYSHGPINARQVFEAELATGLGGGMRAAGHGARWSLLVGAVLVLAMAWGVARYFTEAPAQVSSPSPVVSDSAGLAANHEPITSGLTRHRQLTVAARGAPVHVIVRDRDGRVLWTGKLQPGGSRQLSGVAPFSVHTSNGAATMVHLGRHAPVAVGQGPGKAHRKVR